MPGGDGHDDLFGSTENDILGGGVGNDYLSGGQGDDVLTDGAGFDFLNGGGGADTFLFVADGQNDSGNLGYDGTADLVIVNGVGSDAGTLNLYGVGQEDQIIGYTDSGIEIDLGALAIATGGQFSIGASEFEFSFI